MLQVGREADPHVSLASNNRPVNQCETPIKPARKQTCILVLRRQQGTQPGKRSKVLGNRQRNNGATLTERNVGNGELFLLLQPYNAGIFQPIASIALADADAWRYNIAVNLFGPFHMAKAAIPHLLKQEGRIVNVSSGAANIPVQAGSAYCTSKAALVQFTRVLAAEEPSLTALAVRPGVVDTEMQALIRREGAKAMSAEQLAYYQSLHTEGELEPPSVPARSIAWLSLHAPQDWSGQFLNYDDPEIMDHSIAVFGEHTEAASEP